MKVKPRWSGVSLPVAAPVRLIDFDAVIYMRRPAHTKFREGAGPAEGYTPSSLSRSA